LNPGTRVAIPEGYDEVPAMDDENTLAPAATAIGAFRRVMHQDDKGNGCLIDAGSRRDAAETMTAEFEARGHKQASWIRRQ
jgi:hypothetical protein